ncbi:MAG: hypothetical protein AAF764_07300 [Pseudomonadota bacterium]
MEEESDAPTISGSVPIGVGLASVVRIPIPGPDNLAISLNTNDPMFKGRSTSSIFIQDPTGRKKLLRLDFGINKASGTVDYHWNQKGVAQRFGVTNHQTLGRAGPFVHYGFKAYKWAGRSMVVIGAGLDAYSVVVASKPMQRATEVVSAWAGAWAGCKVVGAGGTWAGGAAGTAVPLVGNAAGALAGGVGGCIIGGIVGYKAGETVGRTVYQWAEDTVFSPVPRDLSPAFNR